jgi:hypothetical protein
MHFVCRTLLLAGAIFSVAGCAAKPPPRWVEGGAQLVIAPARWDREGSDPIEIHADGKITKDGDPYLLVDRAGRVVDEDNEPVAILLPDGQLAGPDNTPLGRVGDTNASPPDRVTAWLAVMPDGTVVFFDEDGDRHRGGVWRGCAGPQHRTCTLITHVISVRNYKPNRSGVGVGLGIGIGF